MKLKTNHKDMNSFEAHVCVTEDNVCPCIIIPFQNEETLDIALPLIAKSRQLAECDMEPEWYYDIMLIKKSDYKRLEKKSNKLIVVKNL